MNISTCNKLRINVTAIRNTATIALRGHFYFDAHREFKAAYIKQLSNPDIDNIVINLSAVDYLDSSALGMLLVLRDEAQAVKKSLVLSSPSLVAQRTFDVAGFYQIFTIDDSAS